MKIGVFVPSHNLKRIQGILTSYKNVDFSFFSYKNLIEVRNQFKENKEFLDGFFFTGLLSYSFVKNTCGEFMKPAVYLETKETDFFRKMFEIMIENPNIDLSRVFFDFHIESKELTSLLNKIPKDRRPIIPNRSEYTINENIYEDIFNTHDQLHRDNHIDWSFTRFSNVVPQLKEKGYNTHYFEVSNETIHSTLIDLVNEINFRALKDTQVACGIITLGNMPDNLLRIKMLNLHSLLLDYNQKSNLSFIINQEDFYFIVMTTRGVIETLTGNYHYCSLLYFLEQFIDEKIHIGWGLGNTFLHARENAKRASDFSKNNNASTTFIINDDDEMIGPLFGEETKSDSPSKMLLSNETIDEIVQETNLTRDKVNKVILSFAKLKNNYITSADFSNSNGVTLRTANRILKEAVDEGLLVSSDDGHAGLQGRPRKLYEINRRFLK